MNISNISLICDCCNTAELIGFAELPCGHTICTNHIIEINEKQFRTKALKSIKYEIDSLKYSNFEDDEYTDYVGKEIRRYSAIYEDLSEIEDSYSFIKEYESCMGTKYFKSQCPICNKENKKRFCK
jgi:hypothetical protein